MSEKVVWAYFEACLKDVEPLWMEREYGRTVAIPHMFKAFTRWKWQFESREKLTDIAHPWYLQLRRSFIYDETPCEMEIYLNHQTEKYLIRVYFLGKLAQPKGLK